ncbi:MAG: putative DNA-binding domain-containing protein [Nannocystaceae bacterium]|nr:DNA-binding domain-containing protein [bacterium]
MNLRDTQALLWRAIAWPTGVDDFLAQADVETRQAFAETFADTPAFSRAARVQVYAEAYFWRLYEVAVDQYPVTAWIAGSVPFHDLITDFVLAHPSRTPDVRRFATGLASMLRTHPLERTHPGLAEVAAVDWAISDAVDRVDEERLSVAVLQRIPAPAWPTARFGLTRTAALLPCTLPYSTLRQAWAAEQPVPVLERTPVTVLVWRQADHDVYQRTLNPAEARALRTLDAGGTFAEACDAAAGPLANEASPADVAGWLQRWLADDLLASYSDASES